MVNETFFDEEMEGEFFSEETCNCGLKLRSKPYAVWIYNI